MPDITWIGSPKFYAQNGVAKLFITDHWMVGTLSSTDSAFNGSRDASSTYGVGESEIHQYVNEKDYPFSDGNTYANQHTISIEHEGGYLLDDGTRKDPSPAVLELSAQLHADIARRHGWGSLAVGVNVFPHGHWVSTACPGSLNIDWIVARANELLGSGGGTITPTSTSNAPTSNSSVAAIQTVLNGHGYGLDIDGIPGPKTDAAIRDYQGKNGLVVDGIVGPRTWAALNGAGVASGGLTVDGSFGPRTVTALQQAIGATADGNFGPQSKAALQRKLGVTADGNFGPISTRALQNYLGVTADGSWGPVTTRALQTRLNNGTF